MRPCSHLASGLEKTLGLMAPAYGNLSGQPQQTVWRTCLTQPCCGAGTDRTQPHEALALVLSKLSLWPQVTELKWAWADSPQTRRAMLLYTGLQQKVCLWLSHCAWLPGPPSPRTPGSQEEQSKGTVCVLT